MNMKMELIVSLEIAESSSRKSERYSRDERRSRDSVLEIVAIPIHKSFELPVENEKAFESAFRIFGNQVLKRNI